MTLTTRTLRAAGAFALAMAVHIPAFGQGHAVEPGPMAADHPLAKQAAAIVEHILAGDRASVIAAMKKDGTPELAASPMLETQIDRHIERVAKKGYKIEGFNTGRGADVIVRLSGGPEETNVVVRFSAGAPHKLEGLAQARPGG